MFGLETLDILIGLITIYLVFGMACTAIVEAFMVWLDFRSSNLEDAFNEFLDGNLADNKKFVDEFYAHPLVQSLSRGKDGRPSFIPAEIVSHVIESLILAHSCTADVKEAIESLPNDSRIKGILRELFTQAHHNEIEFRQAIETHFNSIMNRASGWFKRRAHTVTLMASVILVCGANLDTVSLTNSLASNPNARIKMVEIAQQRVNETEKISLDEGDSNPLNSAVVASKAAKATLAEATANLESANLQLGWKDFPKGFDAWLSKIAGLIVSIFAVSLGAPFWFDVLQKFMQVRVTGASQHDTEKKQPS
jgi:hypothetical protein